MPNLLLNTRVYGRVLDGNQTCAYATERSGDFDLSRSGAHTNTSPTKKAYFVRLEIGDIASANGVAIVTKCAHTLPTYIDSNQSVNRASAFRVVFDCRRTWRVLGNASLCLWYSLVAVTSKCHDPRTRSALAGALSFKCASDSRMLWASASCSDI